LAIDTSKALLVEAFPKIYSLADRSSQQDATKIWVPFRISEGLGSRLVWLVNPPSVGVSPDGYLGVINYGFSSIK
jgi:hypothetical protein